MTEDRFEQETLALLQDVVCAVHSSFGIAPDGPATERASHRKVLRLLERLREAIAHCHGGDASTTAATAATAATGAGCTVSVVLPCL